MSTRFGVTASQIARTAIDGFAAELLSHGAGAAMIFDACIADPECALAQAYAGALFLTRMTRDGKVQASPRVASAQLLAQAQGERHAAAFAAAMAHWLAGRDRDAVTVLTALLDRWPDDLVALKFCQILQLGIGDIQGMLRTAATTVAACSDGGFADGMLAFALDQAGETDRAEIYARRAVDRHPQTDPWAQHALAHVHAAREEWSHGRAFLRGAAASWLRCSSFIRTHNWWHAALFSIELGQRDEALAMFDVEIWGVRKGHCQDQVNAIALLGRLELEGLSAGDRWTDIADHVTPHALDGISPFLDLHYIYALARAGRDAMAEQLAATRPGGELAAGMMAHARGRYAEASLAFGAGRKQLRSIGGSQVQREWFDRLFIDSLARAGSERRLYA